MPNQVVAVFVLYGCAKLSGDCSVFISRRFAQRTLLASRFSNTSHPSDVPYGASSFFRLAMDRMVGKVVHEPATTQLSLGAVSVWGRLVAGWNASVTNCGRLAER